MDNFFSSDLFLWLRVPLVVSLPILIVVLIYTLNRKKEVAKVQELKKTIHEKTWGTPVFNNAGFWAGGALFLFGALVGIVALTSSDTDILPAILSFCVLLLGLFMIYTTSFIETKKDGITVQSLLWKLFGLKGGQKTIHYTDIQKVKKVHAMGTGNPFISLELHTTQYGKVKLKTQFYDSKVGNALYEILRETQSKK